MAAARRVPRGAYGLQIDGILLAGVLGRDALVVVPPGEWPSIRVQRELSFVDLGQSRIDDEEAIAQLGPGGFGRFERRSRSATLLTPSELDDGRLVHPFLAAAGAAFARWLGRDAFHAGAFVLDGGAWGLLGGNEAGKSSTLAHLTLAGYRVISDDLLVIEDSTAFAGPRSIDLRTEALAPLGLNPDSPVLSRVRGGIRFRMELDDVPASVPLRGWLSLSWGSSPRLRSMGPAERLQILAAQSAIRLDSPQPASLLSLAQLPAWELTRPRRWSSSSWLLEEIGRLIRT